MLHIDDEGTIFLYQGDSGELVLNGLNKDLNCTVYFAVQDENRNPVGSELQVSSGSSEDVMFVLTPEFTDLLTVPKNKPYKVYYYGLKVCMNNSSTEDTLFISNGTYGTLNKIVVYPRKVKGVTDGSV